MLKERAEREKAVAALRAETKQAVAVLQAEKEKAKALRRLEGLRRRLDKAEFKAAKRQTELLKAHNALSLRGAIGTWCGSMIVCAAHIRMPAHVPCT